MEEAADPPPFPALIFPAPPFVSPRVLPPLLLALAVALAVALLIDGLCRPALLLLFCFRLLCLGGLGTRVCDVVLQSPQMRFSRTACGVRFPFPLFPCPFPFSPLLSSSSFSSALPSRTAAFPPVTGRLRFSLLLVSLIRAPLAASMPPQCSQHADSSAGGSSMPLENQNKKQKEGKR